MTRAMVPGILVALLGIARADDAPPPPTRASPASDHAQRSTTLFLGTAWAPGPTVPIRVGVESALRFQRAHFAVEARFGATGAGSITGFGSVFGWHLGGGLGAALPLSRRILVTPMAAYDVFGMIDADGASFPVHYVTLELPLAIVFARGAVVEVVGQFGLARYNGATDPAIIVGPRIGLTL